MGNANSDQEEKFLRARPAPPQQYLREHNTDYAHAYDLGNVIGKGPGIPMIYVLSTDGVVRWQGRPHQPNFRKIVEQIIDKDPGAIPAARPRRRPSPTRAADSNGGHSKPRSNARDAYRHGRVFHFQIDRRPDFKRETREYP